MADALNYEDIELHIYGNGAERKEIISYINETSNSSLFYHGELTRSELHKVLVNYDVAIIPLLHRIYGSVPSKIFEYAKLGLPVIYFGGGEGEALVKQHQLGWVAQAGNYSELNNVIQSVRSEQINVGLKERIKATADQHFSFKNQIKDLSNLLEG